jgi:hypothetical protein
MEPSAEPSLPQPRRRGPGKPWQPGERGSERLSKRQLELIASLTQQLAERDGKEPSAASLILIGQISKLATAPKREDGVRNARAIADLLRRLGLDRRIESKAPAPSLADVLREIAAEDAGVSDAAPVTQTALDRDAPP